jgi:hypothetical protein
VLEVIIEETVPCVNINYCADYTNSQDCSLDTCDTASDSGTAVGVDCSLEGVTCYCGWAEEQCNFGFTIDDNGVSFGSCTFDEDMSGDENGCADSYLSYTWTGTWTWSTENPSSSIDPNDSDYIYDTIDGKWHYDPSGFSLTCNDGETTIPCPAQVQLSGFNWINLIAALIIVGLIYWLFQFNKNKQNPKKKVNRK